MNKKLQGFIAGVLCCAAFTGVAAVANQARSIKVYKDNIYQHVANEVTIQNGVPYMSIYDAAAVLGTVARFDADTQSVFFADDAFISNEYLMEVRPPYAHTQQVYGYYIANGDQLYLIKNILKDEYDVYNSGISFDKVGETALFNLGGGYSTIDCVVGHVTEITEEKVVSFYVDGELVKEVVLAPFAEPTAISIPVANGQQLKIAASDDSCRRDFVGQIGVANLILK